MWDAIVKNLARFESAVISGVGADGYPLSARCRPMPDHTAQILRVQLPPEPQVQPGPASLLCHKHDTFLSRQESFVLRGALEHDQQGWLFRPRQLIPGVRPDTLSLTRFVIDCRRKAKRYLATRGLARPKIPWHEINAVKDSTKKRAS